MGRSKDQEILELFRELKPEQRAAIIEFLSELVSTFPAAKKGNLQ